MLSSTDKVLEYYNHKLKQVDTSLKKKDGKSSKIVAKKDIFSKRILAADQFFLLSFTQLAVLWNIKSDNINREICLSANLNL